MDKSQRQICIHFGAEYFPSDEGEKLGIALATLDRTPINGLRHKPEGGTTGWYIWGGEDLSSADDFFQPMHVAHLNEILPAIIPYLGLPAGWRFQVALGHEDVWFDATLLSDN